MTIRIWGALRWPCLALRGLAVASVSTETVLDTHDRDGSCHGWKGVLGIQVDRALVPAFGNMKCFG